MIEDFTPPPPHRKKHDQDFKYMPTFHKKLTQKEQLRHYFLKHAIFYRHVQNKNSATMHKKINNSNRFDIHRLLSSLQEVVHTSQ